MILCSPSPGLLASLRMTCEKGGGAWGRAGLSSAGAPARQLEARWVERHRATASQAPLPSEACGSAAP
jgi:DMSO/TMAO reductase YedYZ molybdopterin-dependent catalytic subunit